MAPIISGRIHFAIIGHDWRDFGHLPIFEAGHYCQDLNHSETRFSIRSRSSEGLSFDPTTVSTQVQEKEESEATQTEIQQAQIHQSKLRRGNLLGERSQRQVAQIRISLPKRANVDELVKVAGGGCSRYREKLRRQLGEIFTDTPTQRMILRLDAPTQ